MIYQLLAQIPPAPSGIPKALSGTSPEGFKKVIQLGFNFTFIIAVFLALVFLILGGIEWITSGGDSNKVSSAKKKITYAVVGLILAMSALMIVNFVTRAIGADPNILFKF